MASQLTIFARLRAMRTEEGQSLSALIDEACDVGEALVAALNLFVSTAIISPETHHVSTDEHVLSAARAALTRATNGTQRREER